MEGDRYYCEKYADPIPVKGQLDLPDALSPANRKTQILETECYLNH